mmetsp:Transcript_22965/g.38295  ORF Transcript_22965/g.38295 Transcript_22965/m.38295 type:complete len:357 (+) Transcript_22965:86-1156(+)
MNPVLIWATIVLLVVQYAVVAHKSTKLDGKEELIQNEILRRLHAKEHHNYTEPPVIDSPYIDRMNVYAVYFAYVHTARNRWQELIQLQLDEFNCNGLVEKAKVFYVCLAIDHAEETDETKAALARETVALVRGIIPNASIEISLENQFEYPGIRKTWDIAQSLPDNEVNNSIILYHHSKGMVFTYLGGFTGVRVPIDIKLSHATFDPWPQVLDMFGKHSHLNKVGCFPAEEGHVWFNLWYARASYLRTVINPTLHKSNRYYFETWLGMVSDKQDSLWPHIDKIHFVDAEEVQRKDARVAGCADCWTMCDANATIGTSYKPTHTPTAYVNMMDWYRCRRRPVITFPDEPFSTNTDGL